MSPVRRKSAKENFVSHVDPNALHAGILYPTAKTINTELRRQNEWIRSIREQVLALCREVTRLKTLLDAQGSPINDKQASTIPNAYVPFEEKEEG